MNSENIYSKFPIFLQNIALNYEANRIKKIRYNDSFFSILNEYKSREYLTVNELEEYRSVKLNSYLKIIKEISPFYSKHHFSIKEFEKLPLMQKQSVKNNYANIIAAKHNSSKSINVHTSGTTGSGLKFITTLTAHQEQFAVWWRYRNWHGIDYNTLCGYFGGRRIVPIKQKGSPFYRFVNPTNQLMFSSYHINEHNIKDYVDSLNTFKPKWLHGYPSILSLVSSLMIEKNLKLNYQLRWISTGAENLLSNQITLIEKAFGIIPIQHYGQAEAVANISECPKGCLHVDEDFSFVEFIPLDSDRFKIVGTNFSNILFPLIRYDTGDVATITGKTCDCGRSGRVINRIDGRAEDYIVLKNGVKVGRLDHIFKDLINIKEAQVYQKEIGKIIVRIVKNDMFSTTDEKYLTKEIKSYLGDIDLEIEYLNEIKKTDSNKLKFVISEIKQ